MFKIPDQGNLVKDVSPPKKAVKKGKYQYNTGNSSEKDNRKLVNKINSKKAQQTSEPARNHTLFNENIWKIDPWFQENIIKEGDYKFKCKSCLDNKVAENWSMGYFENLESHLHGKTHIKNSNLTSEQRESLLQALQQWKQGKIDTEDVVRSKEMIKKIRFDLTSFIVSQGIPFNKTSPLVKFIHLLLNKYTISDIQNTYLSNVTAKEIVTNCISPVLKEDILQAITQNYFSLSIDESSDLYGGSFLAITTKYIQNQKLATKLLSIIPIGKKKTGEAIYNQIKDLIFSGPQKEKIEKHFTGLCTDKGSNMISSKNAGLSNRLKNDYPYIATIHDFSHIFHLVAEKGSLKLPDYIIKTVKTISNHFSRSCLNRVRFRDVQKHLNKPDSDIREILTYVDTRFLSLYETLNRILQLWEDLKEYKKESNTLNVEFNAHSKVSLTILMGLLEKLTSCNEYFQNNNRIFPKIYQKLRTLYITFARIVCKDVSNLESNIYKQFEYYYGLPWDKNDELQKYLLSENDIRSNYLDWQFLDDSNYFKEINEEDKLSLLKGIKEFVIKALIELKRLVPFEDYLLKESEILYLWSFDKEKWRKISLNFPNIISNHNRSKFGNELLDLEVQFKTEFMKARISSQNMDLIKLWAIFEEDYPCLATLAFTIIVLPTSTCPVERVFSQLKNIKTAKRNRLLPQHLEAILLCKQRFQENSLVIVEEMLQRYDTICTEKKPNNQTGNEFIKNDEEEKKSDFDLFNIKTLFVGKMEIGHSTKEDYVRKTNDTLKRVPYQSLNRNILPKVSSQSFLDSQASDPLDQLKVESQTILATKKKNDNEKSDDLKNDQEHIGESDIYNENIFSNSNEYK